MEKKIFVKSERMEKKYLSKNLQWNIICFRMGETFKRKKMEMEKKYLSKNLQWKIIFLQSERMEETYKRKKFGNGKRYLSKNFKLKVICFTIRENGIGVQKKRNCP